MPAMIIRIALVVLIVLGVRIVIKHTSLGDYFFGTEQEEIAPGEWRVYTDEDQQFEVLLPNEPEVSSETFSLSGPEDEFEYHQYLAQDLEDRAYMVRLVYYPNIKEEARAALLDRVVDQTLKADRRHRLRSASERLIQGRRGILFTYDSDGLTLGNIAVQVGSSVYLVTHVDHTDRYDETNFERFLAGFHLLVEEPTP